MILPVRAMAILCFAKWRDITPDYPELKTLIDNMFETMYDCNGIDGSSNRFGY